MDLTNVYRVGQFIDTFAPGHYARVLEAQDLRHARSVAFKVLRPEHLRPNGEMRWEYRAFANEASILHALRSSPNPAHLLDCGYVSTIGEAPSDGEIISFGQDVAAFKAAQSEHASIGWRPYLALENLPRADNMLYVMKPNQPGQRRRLPSEEGLSLALQFANLLRLAHQNRIAYLDHKLEHVYWDGSTLRVIDFNSSKMLEGGAGDARELVKDIHNFCVGILYPLFTGMSPQKGSLLPQPGTREEVEARYSEINELDFSMEPQLSPMLQELMQQGAAQGFSSVDQFIVSLQEVAARHGRDFPGYYTSPATRSARDQLRDALSQLRKGETQIRQARDVLRDALAGDELTDDLEAELRRMVRAVNEMLNHRVIP